MKTGFRTPSIKKSITARTTGKITRSVKKATIPTYGKKGYGGLKNPSKSVYNKVYHNTTAGIHNYAKTCSPQNTTHIHHEKPIISNSDFNNTYPAKPRRHYGKIIGCIIGIALFIWGVSCLINYFNSDISLDGLKNMFLGLFLSILGITTFYLSIKN